MAGKPWTEEMRKAASKRRSGKKLSAEHRAAISRGQLGNRRGHEVGAAIRDRHIARIGTLEERFWKLVDKSGECWLWTGSKDGDGYGISIGKNPPERRAHRMAWCLTYGTIEDGLCICHHCDNPPCCRPDHLFKGTHGDNQRDAWAKGRKKKKFGQDNPMYGKRKVNGKFI